MRVPGSNLLNMALRMIASQTVVYYQDIGRTLTPDGDYVTQLAPGVSIGRGSVQAVDRNRYADQGLDASKSYWNWFVSRAVLGVERGRAGDIIEWQDRRLQVTTVAPWDGMDGWSAVTLVDIGPADGALTSPSGTSPEGEW